tara:strand:- start:53 stop:553 length:501 start_codon:yes stop_codon:yes gene_type:complete
MANNLFYKILSIIGTLGIVALSSTQVWTVINKNNNSEAEITKTLNELKKTKKETLLEIKAIKSDLAKELNVLKSNTLQELKTDRINALAEVQTARKDALLDIEKASSDESGVWLLLRFGGVYQGGGFLEKIPMADMNQCEMQGAVFNASKRLWPKDARGFECLESK